MDLFSDASSQGESSSSSRSPSVDIVEKHSDNVHGDFRINEEYAARFQHNKEREERQRLEKTVAEAESSIESSDEESEDEDGEQMTADVDAAILSTLAKIRRKDESIYQAGKCVFDEERRTAAQSKLLPRRQVGTASSTGKKVTLAQYQRARIQELLKTSDDPAMALAEATMIERRSDVAPYGDADENAEASKVPHSEEQETLRKEVTSAFHSMADEGEEGDDFFTQKAQDQNDQEADWMADDPESYRRYLMDVLGGKEVELRDIIRSQTREAASGDASTATLSLKEKAQKEGISMHAPDSEKDNEDFLVNYVLNRGWVDNPHAAPKISRTQSGTEEQDDDVMSDGSFDSRAEAFETAYNFRFQEMEDGDVNPQIQSYSRHIDGSVRRKENKRKEVREERARRKNEEKEKKRRELDRLRDLKRKSIVDRLKTLKEATGSAAVTFDNLDLDADFDPAEHDRLMAEAFNDDYYGAGGLDDDVKPQWDNDDDDIGALLGEQEVSVPRKQSKSKTDAKKEVKQSGSEPQASTFVTDDGERIEMDADFAVVDDSQAEQATASRPLTKAEKKKAKKREKAQARKAHEASLANGSDDIAVDADEMDAEAQQNVRETEVDNFSAEDVRHMSQEERKKKMEAMMNEYYGLEYEDMIGDQPTRFKYTEVGKSDFGLTPVEILLGDDTELNKVVGLKNLQPYRQGNSRKGPADLKMRLREFRQDFYRGDRKAMAEAMGARGSGEAGEPVKPKKAGKRERERKKAAAAAAAASSAAEGEAVPTTDGDNRAASEESRKDRKTDKKKRHREKDGIWEDATESKKSKTTTDVGGSAL